jgi:2-polyprenyl-6-methoxyphenol hydroxylase-like FAD-dependent oxidoreductase
MPSQDSSATPPSRTDVIIVGAGPVGLLLANLLGQRGLNVVVLERRTAPLAHSAAIGITPPSLHILSRLGLHDKFLELGVKVRDCVIHGASGRLGCVTFRNIPDAFRWVLCLPQRDTCALLQASLAAFPHVTLQTGRKVTDLEQMDERVVVEASSTGAAGAPRRWTASWVVACDGIRSRVRELLQMSGPVTSYPCHFVMGDFIDRTILGEKAHLFFTAEGSVEAFPLPQGLRRWIVQTDEPMKQAPPEFISHVVLQRTGITLHPEDQTNEGIFTPHCFNSERYHSGRVVLCGDAAHSMSPIGGQGMNTGFADAEFLAEILSGIVRRAQDPAPLLASYQRFRRKAAQVAIFRAAWGMWLGTWRGRWLSHLRDFIIRDIMCRWPVAPRMGPLYAMLTIPYNTLERVPHLRRQLRHA